MSGGAQTSVTLYNHTADPVGAYIGGNPSTGGSVPAGSNTLWEMLRAATGQANTSHNLYFVNPDNLRSYLPASERKQLMNDYHSVPVEGLPINANN